MKRKRKPASKEFREEAIRLHGNRCLNCGDDENVEWHHVVPLEIGGNDTPSNTVPLCLSCHKAVTNHQLVLTTVGRRCNRQYKPAGRPIVYPRNYEAILEDYTRCRISKSEAARRLGKTVRFNGERFYTGYLRDHGILRHKNNLDIWFSKHDKAIDGSVIDYIEYEDGTKEQLYYNKEKPISKSLSEIEYDEMCADLLGLMGDTEEDTCYL